MVKRKDPNLFHEGAPYSELLGVDPSQIRKKIRRDSDEDADSLLTSNDLFGEIIDDFEPKEEPAPRCERPRCFGEREA